MNELSDYLKIMNETSFFLQMRVARDARHVFSLVTEEVAFEHGGRAAKLDVLAEKSLFEGVRGFFFIECKRHLHDFSSWIFFTPDVKRQYSPYLLGFGAFHSSIILEKFYEPSEPSLGDSKAKPNLAILTRGFANLKPPMELGYIGIEVKLSESKYRMQELTEVCKDVVTATHGMAMEIVKRSSTDRKTREEPVLFVPIVVTTAKLFTAKADLAKISLSDGKIADDGLEINPVPWLVYEYSLTADAIARPRKRPETLNMFNKS